MAALWPDKPMAYTLPQYLRLQAALLDKSKQVSRPFLLLTREAALGIIGVPFFPRLIKQRSKHDQSLIHQVSDPCVLCLFDVCVCVWSCVVV